MIILALGTKEFYDDMKRFKYLKRLFKKYSLSGDFKDIDTQSSYHTC